MRYMSKTYWLCLLLFPLSAWAQLRPVGLRVEHMTNPSVVDTRVPRLSWINLPSSAQARGEMQTAYAIEVASSREALLDGRADMWRSGRCRSAESCLIPYAGTALKSTDECWWRVRVWDGRGRASSWSEPAHWGMGLLDSSDWQAQWIGAPFDGAAPLLRKAFSVRGKVKRAKAYVSGLGYFEMYVNGRRVGDDCLVPNFTNYTYRPGLDHDRVPIDVEFSQYRVLYLGYDITDLLQPGRNAMGVMLGNGFYECNKTWVKRFGKPCLLCQVLLEYADGGCEWLVSDTSWKARPSAIVVNGPYAGEVYDARRETPQWATVQADEASWAQAVPAEAPMGKLTAQTSPADKVTEVLRPLSLQRLADGSFEVDFGKEISGWIRFRNVSGRAGDTLRVKYVCESPLGVQEYIFKGAETESYAPRFTWYVFSKAVISGVDHLTQAQLQAEAVNTDVPRAARFSSSNPLFDRINEIWQRSQVDNMHGCIASDCPHRERSPYTGDGQVAMTTVLHNFDAASFYQKWIRDMRDAQDKHTGYEPNGAPWQVGCGGGAAWGAAMTLMPWEFYKHYGDRRMLEDSYGPMKRQADYMLAWMTPDSTMNQQMVTPGTDKPCRWLNLGDWSPAFGLPADELVHTFYMWLCLDHVARAARAMDSTADVQHYQALADAVWRGFHRKVWDGAKQSYGDFGSNVYALRMGVPADRLAAVKATLRKEIMATYKGHINTGFVAARYFFETLARNGMNDVAYAVMNQRDFPSFGHWLAQCATVTWEQWDGGNSRNHPMFGGGLVWFYRNLAGVQADEARPGFRHFNVRPVLCSQLDSVSYSLQTSYGEVRSAVRRVGARTRQQVTVPVGSTASVWLGNGLTQDVRRQLKAYKLKTRTDENGDVVVDVPQGSYTFLY